MIRRLEHACELWMDLKKHFGNELAMNISEPLVLHLCGAGKISMAMDFIEEHNVSITFESFKAAVNAIVCNLMKECSVQPGEMDHAELIEKRIACENIRIWIDCVISTQGLHHQVKNLFRLSYTIHSEMLCRFSPLRSRHFHVYLVRSQPQKKSCDVTRSSKQQFMNLPSKYMRSSLKVLLVY